MKQRFCRQAHKAYGRGLAVLDALQNMATADEDRVSVIRLQLLLNQAAAGLKLGRSEARKTIYLCHCALEIDPTNMKARFRLARAYSQLWLSENAEEQLIKALEIEPDNVEIRRELEIVRKNIKIEQQEAARFFAGIFNPAARKPPTPAPAPKQKMPVTSAVDASVENALALRTQLEAFAANTEQQSLDLPATLSSYERSVAHDIAESLGLDHFSKGSKNARHLVISKRRPIATATAPATAPAAIPATAPATESAPTTTAAAIPATATTTESATTTGATTATAPATTTGATTATAPAAIPATATAASVPPSIAKSS